MGGSSDMWDSEVVRKWLERRVEAARLEQAAADKRGYEARDDYDKAAAEEWVCRALMAAGSTDDRAAFTALLTALLAREDYWITGIHDDGRVDRHVRSHLRKVARMTKANEGFANTLRYQG
jgi:hypothetical protein